MFFTFPEDARWNADRQAVEFGVSIGEYEGVVRVPRQALLRFLDGAVTPERCVEAYHLGADPQLGLLSWGWSALTPRSARRRPRPSPAPQSTLLLSSRLIWAAFSRGSGFGSMALSGGDGRQ
jgi:hypothetical protein